MQTRSPTSESTVNRESNTSAWQSLTGDGGGGESGGSGGIAGDGGGGDERAEVRPHALNVERSDWVNDSAVTDPYTA